MHSILITSFLNICKRSQTCTCTHVTFFLKWETLWKKIYKAGYSQAVSGMKKKQKRLETKYVIINSHCVKAHFLHCINCCLPFQCFSLAYMKTVKLDDGHGIFEFLKKSLQLHPVGKWKYKTISNTLAKLQERVC